MELLFGLPSTRIKSRVSIPVYFVSLLGFEVTEVVALNRIDLPWLDKPSDRSEPTQGIGRRSQQAGD